MKRMKNFWMTVVLGTSLLGCGLAVTPGVTVTVKTADGAAAEEVAVAATGETASAGTEATATGSGPGDLAGVITFDGDVPSLPLIHGAGAQVRDKEVCSAEAVPDESLVVNASTKGIQGIFVYLEKAPAGADITPAEPVTFDQKGCRFLPHALLARVKAPVMVLSDDSVAHNTHTFPKRNGQFNGSIPPNDRKGTPVTYTIAEKEPLEVKCDFHPWMRAFHLPLDHQFAAVTDADGKFALAGLPAGNHTFKVWHERTGLLERALKVTIKPGADNNLELKYGKSKFGL